MTAGTRIPFVDLRPGRDHADVTAAIERVVTRGWFVLGPELDAFEAEFAAASGAAHAVGVANGTDAIALILRALDVGPGDEVIVPAMTAAFTALAVTSTGAAPVIVDVEPAALTLDADACAAALSTRTRAIVPVHLYGQPAAHMDALVAMAAARGVAVVEDCCQAHLATSTGAPVGTRGVAGAFSFYPTKNLGALGDGGAVVTNDTALAARVRRLRNGGQAARYDHVEPGMNSRLDEMQAAILRARLAGLADATATRRRLAAAYRERLDPRTRPVAEHDPGHVYHLFPIRSDARDALQASLGARSIETLVHYPVPLSNMPAFARFHPGACPVAERAGRELVSLPLHPRLAVSDVLTVADAVNEFVERMQ